MKDLHSYLRIVATLFMLQACCPHVIGQTLFSNTIHTSQPIEYFEGNSILWEDSGSQVIAVLKSPRFIAKVDSQGSLIWTKLFLDDPYTDSTLFVSAMMPAQSNLFLCGFGEGFVNDVAGMIAMIDQEGSILWMKAYRDSTSGQPVNIRFTDIILNVNNTISVMGSRASNTAKLELVYLHLDSAGNVLEDQFISHSKDLRSANILNLEDTAILLTGYSGNLSDDTSEVDVAPMFFFIQSGVMKWVTDYELPYSANLNRCIRSKDKGFLLIGDGYYRSFVMKIDSAYNVQWVRSFDYQSYNFSIDGRHRAVAELPSGDILVGGQIWLNSGSKHMILIRLTGAGEIVWQKEFEKEGAILSIVPLGSNYFLEGFNKILNQTISIFEADSSGELGCEASYDLLITSHYDSVITDDKSLDYDSSGYEIYEFSFPSESMDSLTNLCIPVTSMQVSVNSTEFIYPNPAYDEIVLHFPPNANPLQVMIFDVAGRGVLTMAGEDLLIEGGRAKLNISALSPGFYFIALSGSDYHWVNKLVKK